MRINRSLFGGLAMSLLLLGAGCSSGLSAGDQVYAEWVPKTWYTASVTGTCDAGYQVEYDDGTKKCHGAVQLIKDKPASRGDVQVGTKVIAKWTGTPYYDAEVIEISDGTYKVQYYDGVKYDVSLQQMRLDPRVE